MKRPAYVKKCVAQSNDRRYQGRRVMKFGLFGSAQAQRGGPDLDSGQGFRDYIEYNVEAEALGYN